MPFKDVLVHVDHNPDSQGRLRLACEIARSHAAGFVIHLTKPLRVQSLDEALAKLATRIASR